MWTYEIGLEMVGQKQTGLMYFIQNNFWLLLNQAKLVSKLGLQPSDGTSGLQLYYIYKLVTEIITCKHASKPKNQDQTLKGPAYSWE